jgi:hypothetical protein
MSKYTKGGKLHLLKGRKIPIIGEKKPDLARVPIEIGYTSTGVTLDYGKVKLDLDPDTAEGIGEALKQNAALSRQKAAAMKLQAVPPEEPVACPRCHELTCKCTKPEDCSHPATDGTDPPLCVECGVRMASPAAQ